MKAIVIGGDGTIGQALCSSLQAHGHDVVATSRRPIDSGRGFWPLDLAGPDIEQMPLPQGDVAFFCAAITRFSDCRANPALARQVNVNGAITTARRLVGQGTHVVLLSTSAVFDWSMPHSPTDRPLCPLTAYGALKAEAEQQFSIFGRQVSILRLSKVLTPNYGLIRNWIASLSAGERITAFSDLHMAPISLDDALTSLRTIAEMSAGGIYQFSSADDISYFNAAQHIAARLGADPDLVVRARAADARIPVEEIVQYSSLDTSRLTSMNGRTAPEAFNMMDIVFGLPRHGASVRPIESGS
jgi:dTDP-4-dehydrorhamnose reductase